ncbi:MAG: DUF6701 domain-containing protein [Pseudomonadota bacterium]
MTNLISLQSTALADRMCTDTSTTSDTGSLTDSGGSSGSYSNDESCQFLIQPSGGGNISLSFSAFRYETSYDFLRIYDGTTTSSTLLGSFTGNSLPADLTASSGSMLIVNETDYSVVRSGFQATWSSTAPSGCPANTIGDNFPSVSFSQNSGSANWTGDWTEIGESDGPSSGIARVDGSNCTSGNCLRIGEPGSSSWTDRGVEREADLTGASSATLSFNYYTGRAFGWETVELQVSANGGSSWTTLQTYSVTGTNFSPTSQSFDISSYAASNTQVRFISDGSGQIGMYVDDIEISYQTSCPLPAPIADWHMDESDWTGAADEVVDSSGNDHHGVATGMSTTDSSSGKICSAGDFTTTGTGDYLSLANSAANGLNDFSISVWAKVGSLGSAGIISGSSGSQHNELLMWFPNDSTFRPFINGSSTSIGISSFDDDTWHHLVWTRSGTSHCLYIDGALDQCRSGGSSSSISIASGGLIVGQEQDSYGGGFSSSQAWDGLLDELIIFDSALSSTQVSTIYTNQDAGNNYDGSARSCGVPNPVAEWQFDEYRWTGTSDEVVDFKGNGLDGTAAGGATTVDAGQVCAAGTFDGTDDYINVSGINTYLNTTASVSFWVKTSQTGNNTVWLAPGAIGVEQAGGTDDVFWGWLDASGRVGIGKGDSGHAKSTTSIDDDAWHHVVLTRDSPSGVVQVYVDGSLEGTSTSGSGDIGTTFASIGRIEDTGSSPEYFNGEIDELLVFDSVIGQNEVDLIFNNQSAGKNYDGSDRVCGVPTPLAEWRLDEASWDGTSGEVTDLIGVFDGTADGGLSSESAQICHGGTFDGVDDHVSLPSISTDFSNGFSASAWVDFGTTQNWERVFDFAQGTQNDNIVLARNSSSDDLTFEIYSGSSSCGKITASNGIVSGVHHYAITIDGSQNVALYRDGVTIATGTSSCMPANVTRTNNYIGRSNWSSDGYFDSQIDELKIFESALTASHIDQIYTNENAGDNYDGTTRSCPVYGPDHFVIGHDTSGIHCLSEAVTVTATNADNSTTTGYTGTITLDTQTGTGTWSLVTGSGTLTDATANDGLATYAFDAADNGVAAFSLYYPEGAASFDIDVYDGSVRDDDTEGAITFAASGFTVTASALSNPPPGTINDPISNQTAGTAFDLHIAAFGTTPTNAQCGVIETYTGNKSLTISTSHVNPSSGSINASGSGSVTFANGQAVVSSQYKDAGQIQLNISDGTISGGTNQFVVKPDSLEVTVSGSDTTAADENGSVYATAGGDFTLTVTAKDSAGDTTPNFGNESSPETIATSHALVAPSGGSAGALSGSMSKTGAGIFSGTRQFSEVGIVNLTAEIADNDYLGAGDVTGTLNNVGRFTPHQFALTSTDSGELNHACSGGSFSYIGQAFGYAGAPTFEVTAQNASGITTTNYTGAYAKLSAGSAIVSTVTQDGTQIGADGITPMALSHSQATKSHSGSNGVYTYTLGADTFTYTRDANAMIGQFGSDIEMTINSVTDGDGVSSSFATGNVLSPVTTTNVGSHIRFGRLSITNGFGSELVDLVLPITAEIFDAASNSFVTHTADSCTTAPSYTITDIDAGDALDATSLTSSVSSNTNGQINLTLSAPGEGSTGGARVTLDAPDYLEFSRGAVSDPDPSGTASFGLYSGSPTIIYRREIR